MKQLVALILFLQCHCFCIAQTNYTRNHFNLLSIKDGMPEGTVADVLQDKEGYMWIATQKGLVRYNGYTSKVYDFGIKDPYAMNVQNLLEDSKGRLWATVNSGLYVYNRSQDN
jgi:ligand-binding sensor domain-containing protein